MTQSNKTKRCGYTVEYRLIICNVMECERQITLMTVYRNVHSTEDGISGNLADVFTLLNEAKCTSFSVLFSDLASPKNEPGLKLSV